jgi:hypothetical protein
MKNLKTLCLFISFTALSTLNYNFSLAESMPVSGEKRDVGSFDQLDLGGAFTVTLVQGNEESVVIDAVPEIASKIITKVEAGKLKIYNEKHFKSEDKITVTVNFKTLKSIDCSGACSITASGKLQFDDLSMDASGACKTNLELTAKKLDISISGAGNNTLSGSVTAVELDISGAGKLQAASLQADDYEIDISGTGNAEISVAKTLDVEVSGTGNIKYKGDPVIKKEISGTGNIIKM